MGVYLPTIDVCCSQLARRYELSDLVVSNSRFLFPKTLTDSLVEELSEMVAVFVSADVVSDDLLSQVLAFHSCAAECIQKTQENNSVKELLNIVLRLELVSGFPDLVTAFTLFLTLPVSVHLMKGASLRLNRKTYLRSSMMPDRLSDLGLLSIEKSVSKTLPGILLFVTGLMQKHANVHYKSCLNLNNLLKFNY